MSTDCLHKISSFSFHISHLRTRNLHEIIINSLTKTILRQDKISHFESSGDNLLNESLCPSPSSVNFKKNEKAYDSTGSEVFKMLQEAKNDPAEPGNLIVMREQEPLEHEQENQIDYNVDASPRQDSPPPQIIQNSHNNINNNRDPETYETYLMLATMLKYLNNGNAFAENHLED